MRIVRGLPPVPPEAPPAAVALGVFDGVHLGHRAILGLAVSHAGAAGMRSIACTFDPHPMEVLQPGRAPLPITTLDERLVLIEGCGLDCAVVLPFTRELAERSASEARAAAAEFERRTAAARAEIYKQMDEMRRAALAERADILARTRAEAEAGIAQASAALQAEADEARRRLAADAEQLGQAAADRILGRRAS